MLGRLKMTLEVSKAKFLQYSSDIFRHPRLFYRMFRSLGWFLFSASAYSEKRIVNATSVIVGEFDPSSESDKWKRNMFSSPGDHCRTCDLDPT